MHIAIMLVEYGAKTDIADPACGRQPIHNACQGGSLALVEFLIAHCEVEPHVVDNYGDSPLHIAAEAGHVNVVNFLCEWQQERLQRFLAGKDGVDGAPFQAVAKKLYDTLLRERLTPYQTRRFPITWMRKCHTEV